MKLAPIILFCYNRPNHTRKTLEALSRNIHSMDSELFIFADGPKTGCSQENLRKIQETRSILKERQWCGRVSIHENTENKGLASSIITGVTSIINKFGSAIILEDDIETGIHFLEYMNEALVMYKDEKKVMHISAFRPEIKTKNPEGSFFYPNMDCWGWGTWSDRWKYFEKNPAKLTSTFSKKMIHKFNMDGSEPGNWSQVISNLEGKINTWAIFWLATIFEHDGLCLGPCRSLTRNIGFDDSGEHCGANPHEEIKESIDHKVVFLPSKIEIDKIEYKNQKKFFRKKNKIFLKNTARIFVPRPILDMLISIKNKSKKRDKRRY